MRVLTIFGTLEVFSEEIAPGLFVTPWIRSGGVVAGWTVTAQNGYCLTYVPLCRNRARKLANDLAGLVDWTNVKADKDRGFTRVDVERIKAMCWQAEREPFCE